MPSLRLILPALCLWLSVSGLRAEAMLQLFNLSWNEVAEKIPEIAEAGYTSLWLPPPTKGGGGSSIGYDLFDPFDLGDKDQRGTVATLYGTKQDLLRMIEIAHRFGLRVYFDNIMNHRGPDVPGYNSSVPTNLYPGTVPGDFHLRINSEGFYRNASNVRDYNNTWQVQNLSLLGLVDIAHENPNANHGTTEGSTITKPVLVRHPNNPEYYDTHPTLGRVGFGNVSQSVLNANPNFYREDINAYLLRSVRYLFDQTHCDGLRLDAVKHVPSYFFGLQSGANKETNFAGYVGNAQLQFNLAHGYDDSNQRNSNFDSERTRNDALVFGEHLGEPPGFGEYVDAGMRLLDNPLRNHLNNVLGNPSATLAGLEQRDAGGFAASVRVMHAQSHDNDFAARRELQNAYYFMREGIPLIYSDGYNESPSGGGTPFPRHANANYLGQFGDNKMPDVAWLHHQVARGGTRPRWGDADIVAFERYDYREGTAAADQTVLLFIMNDNYSASGDISFDDGVAQSDAGMPSTCYPVVNSRNQGLVVGFPPGSRLRQLSDSPGKSRACTELLVRQATNVRNDATASANDANPVNRKIFVGSQGLASGGGAVELKIPSGGYVVYSYQWPEPSRVDTTITNSTGVVAPSDVIVIRQGGKVVPELTVYRRDGKDGDAGFNPLYPFKMRGSISPSGNVLGGTHVSNFTYAIDIPVVTNAAPLDFLVRADGSVNNVLLKLDGGLDLNSHMNLGPSNTTTYGVLDLRDNLPDSATDVYLGYEQARFQFRYGPEKFAARSISRNNVLSLGAETYAYTIGSDATTNVVNGNGLGDNYPEETCAWVYHDPAASNNVAGQAAVRQRSATLDSENVHIWVKAAFENQITRCFIYYTTDGSEPEGAYGTGHGATAAVAASFSGNDATDSTIDWWRGTIPAHPLGTLVKYKVALHKRSTDRTVNPIADYADSKRYALTQFAITNWNPAGATVWLHNNLATNQVRTGLAEGYHILRARTFLPRTDKASIYNTFLQTFYYDTVPPEGVIAFPANNGDTLRSTEYDFVVRADAYATEVEFNISDGNPNNDDAVTGLRNGNGLSNGAPVFTKAGRVSPSATISRQYPQFPQEFRFTYQAVPASGTATITVRIKEITSDLRPNHFKTLIRTVNTMAPAQTLTISSPPANGMTINLPDGAPYMLVGRFSSSLTADVNAFSIYIDGAFQPRTNELGEAQYIIQDPTPGDGTNEVRFEWKDMTSAQHYIQMVYVGDGLNLQASRLVRVNVQGQSDGDGDGLPDSWEQQHNLNSNDPFDANGAEGDPDGDAFTNISEYIAGTDPQDPASLLKITQLQNGGQIVTWSSVPGKTYQVYATTSVTESFERLSLNLVAFGDTRSYTNTTPGIPMLFYRVKVLP